MCVPACLLLFHSSEEIGIIVTCAIWSLSLSFSFPLSTGNIILFNVQWFFGLNQLKHFFLSVCSVNALFEFNQINRANWRYWQEFSTNFCVPWSLTSTLFLTQSQLKSEFMIFGLNDSCDLSYEWQQHLKFDFTLAYIPKMSLSVCPWLCLCAWMCTCLCICVCCQVFLCSTELPKYI